MQRYNPKEFEQKWQKTWEENKTYQAEDDSTKPKKYVLEFFPYPSGAAMHVGHVRNYAIGDALSRFARMRGYNVLHPMGWDAFGLPAENYAIKTGISPRQAIDENTGKFKQQLTQMGFGYDWSREIDSSDPGYYRWTQWFFLLLFNKGLAYQKDSLQWWCPVDKTVLANEQVEAGRCWRCGSEVEKKALKQWFFKITNYADRLAKDLDDVNWSESIKSTQRNWIGRSKGAEITFAVAGAEAESVATTDVEAGAETSEVAKPSSLKVFTTRPDTIYGVTFMVIAPEHPMVAQLTTPEHKQHVENYLQKSRNKSEIERQETNREKTGVPTGSFVINPANGEQIPVWVADYVLMGYGTGAIMAVPAHDERDHEFAQKFGLPERQVVAERFMHTDNPHTGDAPLVPRHVVTAVIKHPTDDLYLIAKPTGSDFWAPLMGGIDEGETAAEAAAREIREESGYTDIAEISQQGPVICSEFYAQHKQENRIAYCQTVVVHLGSLNQTEITPEEQAAQTVEWVTLAEAKRRCTGAGAAEILAIAEGVEPAMAHEGRLINSGEYDGQLTSDARETIVAGLSAQDSAQEKINYKMRDWLISRQRYWGAPIPIVHCAKDGAVAVPEDQLPVMLPDMQSFEPSGDGRSPLARDPEFVNTTCPTCGGPATRETDTMDGFACSSWYFLRFADPHNLSQPFDAERVKYWLPVDDYIGGAEHAVMHLLYARFWTKVMHDEGLIGFNEPFKTLRNHGMILAPDGSKMSKSKGNTIQPGELIDQGYGADSIRIMELFIGPWNQMASWSVEGMGGSFRFLQRTWNIAQEYMASAQSSPAADGRSAQIAGAKNESQAYQILRATHATIKKVTADLENMGFNTAIAALMELLNELYKIKPQDNFANREAWKFAIESFVQMLAPFAPHIAEELWQQLGHETSVHTSVWPAFDEKYLVRSTVTIAIQVNGKLRGQIEVATTAGKDEIIAQAQAEPRVAAHLASHELKKTIVVPGKLVSFVL